MAKAEVYRTKDGYIVKTSSEENYEFIRSEKGFLRKDLGKGTLPTFIGTKVKDIPNELKRYFYSVQKEKLTK